MLNTTIVNNTASSLQHRCYPGMLEVASYSDMCFAIYLLAALDCLHICYGYEYCIDTLQWLARQPEESFALAGAELLNTTDFS